MFLGHLLFLRISLDNAAIGSEFFHSAVEKSIFPKFTFQASIENRDFDGWFETNLFKTFFAIAENPCIVTRKSMFEPFAYHLVGGKQVGG